IKTETMLDQGPAAPPTRDRDRWMVVDDNEDLADFLASLLETTGVADVQRCYSGAEALAALRAAPDQFRFVITDLDMPGMNGIECCRRMRAGAPRLKVAL